MKSHSEREKSGCFFLFSLILLSAEMSYLLFDLMSPVVRPVYPIEKITL